MEQKKGYEIVMKKVLSSVLSFVYFVGTLALAFFFLWRPAIVYQEYIGDDEIYVGRLDNGFETIIRFNEDRTVELFQYKKDLFLNTEYYYGLKIVYEYSGTMFNKIIWKLHYFPNTGANIWSIPDNFFTFWKNYAFYDGEKEQRAIISTKVVSNIGLNIDASKIEPATGKYKDTLIIDEDKITYGGEVYQKPNALERAEANKVMKLFEKNGTTLE